MLKDYAPIYQLGVELEALRQIVGLHADSGRGGSGEVSKFRHEPFKDLLKNIQKRCAEHGLVYTSEMAKDLLSKPLAQTYAAMFTDLNHLDRSLGSELKKESVFRIPPERAPYYEQKTLFGAKVAGAFPSCKRDIHEAGSCYALGRADACVHHLMMVLERGLHALADNVGVTYHHANWQLILDQIDVRLRTMPRGSMRDFYLEAKSQFGFLKVAYRNHSEHTRDDPYDLPKALSILNHVRSFMQELAKGGLSE